MFIGMDPPKHDRLKALFQAGFTPKRIAAHEDVDPRDRRRRARPSRGPRDLRPRHRRRPARGLASDRQLHGDPGGGRRGLGGADEHGAGGERPRLQPGGRRQHRSRDPERDHRDLRPLQHDDRRAAREPDRRPDERPRPRRGRRRDARGARDRDGLLPPRRRRQRQHQGDLLQRDAGAAGRPRASAARARRPGADSRRGRGVAADVPRLRPLPPHRDQGHRC